MLVSTNNGKKNHQVEVGEILAVSPGTDSGLTTKVAFKYEGKCYILLSNALQARIDKESHTWDTETFLQQLISLHLSKVHESKNVSMWNKFLMFILRRK